MGALLLELADQCDGLRCDMAMLPLPKVIQRTWGYVLNNNQQEIVDFWPAAIQAVKDRHPGFCFLAEVYWDMEWTLQQQGFDYTYDKGLLDRLHQPVLDNIKSHLHAEMDFQKASARFMENHDEDRSRSYFSPDQAQAAALITYTIPGMRFFYQGQWEGRRLRLPVQLGREPQEVVYNNQGLLLGDIALTQLPGFAVVEPVMVIFYERLLQLLRQPALKQGQWERLHLGPKDVLAWQWQWEEETYLIIVNYEPIKTAFRLPVAKGHWQHFDTDQAATSQQHLVGYEYLILFDKPDKN
jgi:glycosidase